MNNPFVPQKKTSKGIETGELFYETKEIYLKFVQSGVDEKGEAIGEMVPAVKVVKTDIIKLINSHADEVGVKNMIKLFNRTGDYSVFQQKPILPDGDYTKVMVDVEELKKTIPADLIGDKTVEEFLQSLTPEQFKAWAAAQAPAADTEKKEGSDE